MLPPARTGSAATNRRLAVLLSIIALDAVGIGLIFPILPALLRELTGSAEISVLYGVVLALYALMQFICSPVLGAFSDRFGRRPVLLASVAGATIDYLFMAFAPVLSVLLIGRAIAGITSANLAVATAYVADITEEAQRAKRIGYINGAFGIGFFIGPIVGGVLGMVGLRVPFLAAAMLNALTLALVFFMLPESRCGTGTLTVESVNPLGSMRWAIGGRSLRPLLGIYLLLGLIGNLVATIWILYGQDRFDWDTRTVGISLAMLGICHAASQGLLIGPLTSRFGERMTVVIGIVCDATAMTLMGIATNGWIAFALSPVFALGAVGVPALQSLMTNAVDEMQQGELQGVLASITSLTSVIGPLVASSAYAITRRSWIGAVWIVSAALYALMIPLMRSAAPAQRPAIFVEGNSAPSASNG